MIRVLHTIAALIALCVAGVANASTLYVTEFVGGTPATPVLYQAARTPALVQQAVTYTASSVQSAAFSVSTGLIRIQCDSICNVTVGGTNPTAVANSSMRLTAGQTEYFTVRPGDKVAVITGT